MSNSDISREVGAILAVYEASKAEGWSWRKGVVLFPEARCPWCKAGIVSKAIWLVEGYYLRGQGVPKAGQEFKLDKAQHPHSLEGDGICMGDATDPLQALFHGLNPESAYGMRDPATGREVSFEDWLRGPYWEHSCPEMDEESEEDDYTYFCEACDRGLSEDDGWWFADQCFCESCFHARAFTCYACSETWDIDEVCEAFDDAYCHDCFSSRFFTCPGCDDVFKRADEKNSSGQCTDCYEWPNVCAGCEEGFDLEQGGDSCESCNKPFCLACAHADGGPLESHVCDEVAE